jgi:hypothetical protein
MCSNQPRRFSLRHVFTNWRQPLPLRVKLALTAKNAWRRVTGPSSCCGHPGEPGC